MEYSPSKPCFRFLKPLLKYTTILGLTPSYDFKSHRITNKIISRCYSVCLCTFLSAISVNSLMMKYELYLKHKHSTVYLLDILTEVVGIATFAVTSLRLSFWKIEEWKKLIIRLKFLRLKCNATKTKSKTTPLLRLNLLFLIASVTYVILFIVVPVINDINTFLTLASATFFSHSQSVISSVACNMVVAIKYKYECINCIMMDIRFKRSHDSIITVRKLYLAANETIHTFNDVFGWYLFGIVFHLAVQLLTFLIIMSTMVVNAYLTTICIVSISILLLGPISIIFGCDMAVKEAKKLLLLCSKLEDFVDTSEGHAELIKLEDCVVKYPPMFTAARFFHVSRSTLLYVLGAITTYYIIAIQFEIPSN